MIYLLKVVMLTKSDIYISFVLLHQWHSTILPDFRIFYNNHSDDGNLGKKMPANILRLLHLAGLSQNLNSVVTLVTTRETIIT